MNQKDWNRKGKRKRLICFEIADIAERRGGIKRSSLQSKAEGIIGYR